jgi:hypothetical protein
MTPHPVCHDVKSDRFVEEEAIFICLANFSDITEASGLNHDHVLPLLPLKTINWDDCQEKHGVYEKSKHSSQGVSAIYGDGFSFLSPGAKRDARDSRVY